MPNTTYGTPYAQSSDLVSNWPGVSLNVADRIDDVSFKGNGLNDQTGTSYTLVLTDAGKTVTLDNAAAVTVTVPTNASVAFEIGTQIEFSNKGAGVVTISAAGGVTLNNASGLPQHASGYIRKLDSNTWVMVPISSGVSTLITSGSLSGASVSLSNIPGIYNDLRLLVLNFLPATDVVNLQLRLNNDSGANRYFSDVTIGTASATAFNATSWTLGTNADNAVTQGVMDVFLPSYANATTWKTATSLAFTNDATTTTSFRLCRAYGVYNQTAAITSMTMLPSSGNFTSGTYLLYGIR